MVRLLGRLDDWNSVRLGALGPVAAPASDALNRKRASFLSSCVHEYGSALGEVFALFVLQSSSDQDSRQVLLTLARDKRLSQTLGPMAVVSKQLQRRGLPLSDFPDRPERLGQDMARGALEGLGEVVSTIPLFQAGESAVYDQRKQQLPAPYRRALTQVEQALVKRAFTSGQAALGLVDEVTFGVPLGFYYLAVGTSRGVSALTEGEYERAMRELTPAALMVSLYAGGKGLRTLSELRGSPAGALPLQALELRLEELKETAQRLQAQLGGEGLEAVARYLQADPEAALFVAEGGEAGARALYETRGDVPKAQAWLSQNKERAPGTSRTTAHVETGSVAAKTAALVDEATIPQEVLDAKFLQGDLDARGPRLSGDTVLLRKQLTALRKAPPAGAPGQPLWGEYVRYGEERLAELEQGTKVKGRALEPPLQWEGYQRMRGLVKRGLVFERAMVELLRADAALPRAQRRFLGDFNRPHVEQYVGVWKPRSGLRFVDALVIEEEGPSGSTPRVETLSFKSRDLSGLRPEALETQMIEDSKEALRKYGETLDIRRESLHSLLHQGSEVPVQRVRLIYEGGVLLPKKVDELKAAVTAAETTVKGVEVSFQ